MRGLAGRRAKISVRRSSFPATASAAEGGVVLVLQPLLRAILEIKCRAVKTGAI